MNGYILIHRKLLNWQWYKDSNTLHLFIDLLLDANYEDSKFGFQVIKRGQCLTSLKRIHENTGLTYREIRTSLDKLQKSGEIGKQTTNKYSIITIKNYDDYQNMDKQTANKRQTKGNIKEYKEYKEEKEIIDSSSARAREAEWISEFLNSRIQIQAFCMQNGVSEGEFGARAREVINDWELTGVTHSDETDFKTHLLSTIRIKLNNGTTNANQRNYADDRQAEREQLARSYAATIARRLAEDNERASGLRGPDEIPF